MTTTKKTTHDEEALALLLEQLKNKPQLEALLSIYIAQVQDIENVLDDVLQLRWIDNATNDQLDVLGSLVGVAREGRVDDAYRVRIKAQIRANYASGIAQDFYDVFTILLGTDSSTKLTDYPPAAFIAEVGNGGGEGLSSDEAFEVVSIFRRLRGAGIDGQIIYSLENDDNTFTFANSSSEEDSSTQGFADNSETSTTGGVFASVES